MGSRDVIDVNSVILSKCHSGESLLEYYLQEFQYGKDVFQTTTKLCPSGVSMKVVTHFPFNFGYSNIE